jgi:ABC-2 type transport system ATP-binding protein
VIETFTLGKHFGDKVALHGLDLRVESGEVLGLLGPNGAGKTTALRLLMGLYRPSCGRATVLGRDCTREAVALKHDIGYLPDDPFLHPYLSSRHILELSARLHGAGRAEARRRAEEVLEQLALGEVAGALGATLSQGMRRRVALAAAVLHQPRVLILDEPTTGLDPRAARDLRAEIARLAGQGRTVLLSTHLADTAERLCHRVAIVQAGRLVAAGTLAELRARLAGGRAASLEELYLEATGG